MLKPKAQLNLANARAYFREHLTVGDYYTAEKLAGEWRGEGASRLGLTGVVCEADFLALCDGRDPSGARLTARRNHTRRTAEGASANRRIFYDFTISPPKSVSLVALAHDPRIVALHEAAVRTMLAELERFAETRVRRGGANTERATGNLVAACFRHDTSRELDPHLHTHCVVFNATFDPIEQRWKALHPAGLYRAQKFAENLYYHELTRGLRSLGYAIENTRTGFELRGVSPAVIARFSKRHAQIDNETQRRMDAGFTGNVAALREQIAHGQRRRKTKESTAARLRGHWTAQLSPEEQRQLAHLRGHEPSLAPAPAEALAWADEHLFARRSVVEEHELLATALARGRGGNYALTDFRAALAARDYVRETGTTRLTARDLLRCELEIVLAARDGRGQHAPLAPTPAATAELSSEQRAAITHLLGSRDFITLFRGGAGTGKSFTLRTVEHHLRAAGHPVVVLAPQRQQVVDLGAEGLPAVTLAQQLVTRTLPRAAVVVLDEAGQVGARQLHALLGLVRHHGGRLILSGDTAQHGAVAASDALRAIERHAGLVPAILRQIRRQDPKRAASLAERRFIAGYRAAVRAAARGDAAGAFTRLEQLGCIRETSPAERRAALAAEFAAARQRGDQALVVAPTREEVRAVNAAIRDRLRADGQLGASVPLTCAQPLDLDDAQKRDPRFYTPGQQVYFLRRYGRYAKGDVATVLGATERGLLLDKAGRRATLSYRYTDRLVVAQPTALELAPGDRLQLKFNGRSREGRPLANGELVTVEQVRPDGTLAVRGDDGRRKTLTPHQRLFVRGYAVTSYGSQGKTVDTVLFADAACIAATNAKQWYVTISRGRRRVAIFTSDKESLRARIQQAGERSLAVDLRADAHTEPQRALRRLWANILQTQRHTAVVSQQPQALRQRLAS